MAPSPAHRLGQIIGDALEAAIRPCLIDIADRFGLYLDYKHARPARGGKTTVAWTDSLGNKHDLDYVLEEGGSEAKIGRPRAFIEVAWRRYTKHSRNKAQEIQSAIKPLAEKYQDTRPFLGVVVGGIFTAGSLDQLRSHDFNVVYFPYDSVLHSFAKHGLDVSSNEDTSEEELQRRVDAYDRTSSSTREELAETIRETHREQIEDFLKPLDRCIRRSVTQVLVLPLSGDSRMFDRVEDAVRFILSYDQEASVASFVRYELQVRYSNGDEVRGIYQERDSAIEFLRKL